MTVATRGAAKSDLAAGPRGQRLKHAWLRRTALVVLCFVSIAILVPQLLGLSGPWRAFGAGLVVPGAGLLYAIPPTHHPFSADMVIGHAVVIALEIALAAVAIRHFRKSAVLGAFVCLGLLVAATMAAPSAIVIAGHVAGFIGVLGAMGWALAVRVAQEADTVTPVAVIVGSAAIGAGLTAIHGDMPGPMTWVPWAALALVITIVVAVATRALLQNRRAERVGAQREKSIGGVELVRPSTRTSGVALERPAGAPVVTEATNEQVQLLRYLLSVANQPAHEWDGFDDEASGPLQKYRYQVNALGWALATYNYAHTPAFTGVLTDAQVALFDRAQDKAVWGYWYMQNLLGNWDFFKRRADPIDVPQNIMFTGYLNLQLGMFRQATGDPRFDEPDAIVFDWSQRQRFGYNHRAINAIAVRNFDQDLCLWPCEPVVSPGRARGFVFPYCNAVTAAGISVMDAIAGTHHGLDMAARFRAQLDSEFTDKNGDLVAFMLSGVGLSVRFQLSGPPVTALISALLAPLLPDLAERAWKVLKHEWLESGSYLTPGSAGKIFPDWGSNEKTNAESLAAAMMLADACGEQDWHAKLWTAACDQLHYTPDSDRPGVWSFADASIHANGMLGFAGIGRSMAFTDMMTKPRPGEWNVGPRLIDAPHPNVLVTKAVSDGRALDLVLRAGDNALRAGLRFDRLEPGRRYVVHGATTPDMIADVEGRAQIIVDIDHRTPIELRPI